MRENYFFRNILNIKVMFYASIKPLIDITCLLIIGGFPAVLFSDEFSLYSGIVFTFLFYFILLVFYLLILSGIHYRSLKTDTDKKDFYELSAKMRGGLIGPKSLFIK